MLFCLSYKHNSPLLTRKVDYEYVRSTIRIKIAKYVRALKMKRYVKSLQKQAMGQTLNEQNSQLLYWFLPSEDIFQVHRQKWPVANLLGVDFHSQPEEMPLPKRLNV